MSAAALVSLLLELVEGPGWLLYFFFFFLGSLEALASIIEDTLMVVSEALLPWRALLLGTGKREVSR